MKIPDVLKEKVDKARTQEMWDLAKKNQKDYLEETMMQRIKRHAEEKMQKMHQVSA